MKVIVSIPSTKLTDTVSSTPQPSTPQKVASKATPNILTWLVGALLIFGVAMRIWILTSPFGRVDADESVVGLMARALLHGDPSIYFWGQPYGGSQESMMAAVVFAITGSSVLALKLVPMALGAVAAWLLWQLGKRTVGERAARLGAALFWATPFAFVWLTTKERGFYASTMVFVLGALLCAIDLSVHPTGRRCLCVAAVGGFLVGLAFWASVQAMFVILPTVTWLLARRSEVLRTAWAAIAGFIVGALPAILFAIHTHGHSLIFPSTHTSPYTQRLSGFFTTGLPLMLGLKVPYSSSWTVPVVAEVVYVLALIAMFIGLISLVRKRKWLHEPKALLLVIVLSYPFLFAISPFSLYLHDPRYLWFMAAPFALLLADIALRRGQQVLLGVVGVGLCVLSMTGLLSWPEQAQNHDLNSGDLSTVISTLNDHGTRVAYADYWIAYRLTFTTHEQIAVTPINGTRSTALELRVQHSQAPAAYVFYTHSGEGQNFADYVAQQGISVTREQVGQFTIYFPNWNLLPSEVNKLWNGRA